MRLLLKITEAIPLNERVRNRITELQNKYVFLHRVEVPKEDGHIIDLIRYVLKNADSEWLTKTNVQLLEQIRTDKSNISFRCLRFFVPDVAPLLIDRPIRKAKKTMKTIGLLSETIEGDKPRRIKQTMNLVRDVPSIVRVPVSRMFDEDMKVIQDAGATTFKIFIPFMQYAEKIDQAKNQAHLVEEKSSTPIVIEEGVSKPKAKRTSSISSSDTGYYSYDPIAVVDAIVSGAIKPRKWETVNTAKICCSFCDQPLHPGQYVYRCKMCESTYAHRPNMNQENDPISCQAENFIRERKLGDVCCNCLKNDEDLIFVTLRCEPFRHTYCFECFFKPEDMICKLP
jgi:hypothetical protein